MCMSKGRLHFLGLRFGISLVFVSQPVSIIPVKVKSPQKMVAVYNSGMLKPRLLHSVLASLPVRRWCFITFRIKAFHAVKCLEARARHNLLLRRLFAALIKAEVSVRGDWAAAQQGSKSSVRQDFHRDSNILALCSPSMKQVDRSKDCRLH